MSSIKQGGLTSPSQLLSHSRTLATNHEISHLRFKSPQQSTVSSQQVERVIQESLSKQKGAARKGAMKSNDASSKDDNTPPLMVPRRQQEPPQTFKNSPTVSISRITLETNKKNMKNLTASRNVIITDRSQSSSSTSTLRQSTVFEAVKSRDRIIYEDQEILRMQQSRVHVSVSPEVQVVLDQISVLNKNSKHSLGNTYHLISNDQSKEVTEISFSKCSATQQMKETLNAIYEASPFKIGIHQVDQTTKKDKSGIIKKLINYEGHQEYTPILNKQHQPQQSEDIIETLDELIQTINAQSIKLPPAQDTPSVPPETTIKTFTSEVAEFKDEGFDPLTSVMLQHVNNPINNPYTNLPKVPSHNQRDSLDLVQSPLTNLAVRQNSSVDYDYSLSNPQMIINHQHQASQLIDVSLNKSHMTMEDNNKVTRKVDTLHNYSKSVNVLPDNMPPLASKNEGAKFEELEERKSIASSSNSVITQTEIKQSQQEQNQVENNINQEKIFALIADQMTTSHKFRADTSFDTLASIDNINYYIMTQSEEQQPTSYRQLMIQNSQQQKSIEKPSNADEASVIDQELKKISSNLNTFTVEHFNQLRQHIESQGFQKAAKDAKKEYHLITGESTNTLQSKVDLQQLIVSHPSYRELVEQKPQRIEQLNKQSKIQRQLVIFEMHQDGVQLDAKQIVEATGFCCAPSVIFSEKDQESRIYIDKRQSILTRLMTPGILKTFLSNNVTMISCGFEHCLLLNQEGLVMSWGCGASGSLGHGDYVSYTEPKIIEGLKHQTKIQSGGYHNSSIGKNGQLFMWGRSDVGQLGIPKLKLQIDSNGLVATRPQEVEYFKNKIVEQVALGEAHSLVLDSERLVHSFGWGELGQLGVGEASSNDFQIHQVKLKSCSKINAGAVFSAALTTDGELYAWGSVQNGQLGIDIIDDVQTNILTPRLVSQFKDNRIVDLNCGEAHSIVETASGMVYAWGQGKTINKVIPKNQKKQINSSFNEQGNEYMDVVSFYPKEIGQCDIFHPLLIKEHQQIEIISQVKQVLNKLQSPEATVKAGIQIISSAGSSSRLMEPNIFIQRNDRSNSPQVASENEISDEFDYPIESSRVLDDNSDSHHRYHHQEIISNISSKGISGGGKTSLNLRNLDSHIRQPHTTQQMQSRGSLITPMNLSSKNLLHTSPLSLVSNQPTKGLKSNPHQMLGLESPMNQQQIQFMGLTSTKAGSQNDMLKDFQEFTNQKINEGSKINDSIKNQSGVVQQLHGSPQNIYQIRSIPQVTSTTVLIDPKNRVMKEYNKICSQLKEYNTGFKKIGQMAKTESRAALASQNTISNIHLSSISHQPDQNFNSSMLVPSTTLAGQFKSQIEQIYHHSQSQSSLPVEASKSSSRFSIRNEDLSSTTNRSAKYFQNPSYQPISMISKKVGITKKINDLKPNTHNYKELNAAPIQSMSPKANNFNFPTKNLSQQISARTSPNLNPMNSLNLAGNITRNKNQKVLQKNSTSTTIQMVQSQQSQNSSSAGFASPKGVNERPNTNQPRGIKSLKQMINQRSSRSRTGTSSTLPTHAMSKGLNQYRSAFNTSPQKLMMHQSQSAILDNHLERNQQYSIQSQQVISGPKMTSKPAQLQSLGSFNNAN